MSDSAKLEAAREAAMKAISEYTALLPPVQKPVSKPKIKPTLFWANPDIFHPGYNACLDYAGAPSVGKIPVIVMPVRPHDVTKYSRILIGPHSVYNKLREMGIKTPSNYQPSKGPQ